MDGRDVNARKRLRPVVTRQPLPGTRTSAFLWPPQFEGALEFTVLELAARIARTKALARVSDPLLQALNRGTYELLRATIADDGHELRIGIDVRMADARSIRFPDGLIAEADDGEGETPASTHLGRPGPAGRSSTWTSGEAFGEPAGAEWSRPHGQMVPGEG